MADKSSEKKRMTGSLFVFIVAFVLVRIWDPALIQAAHPSLWAEPQIHSTSELYTVTVPLQCTLPFVAPMLSAHCGASQWAEGVHPAPTPLNNGMKGREKAVSTETQLWGFQREMG